MEQSIITSSIVTYNTSLDELDRLIKCVDLSIITVVYVIDNSPEDRLRLLIENLSEKIVYIFNNGNIGYGAGHNIGLKKAIELHADYHIVLNPDIYFDEGTIEVLSEYMEKNREIGAVMPMIKYPNEEIQYLCKLQPTPFDLIGRRFLPKKLTLKRNNKYELRYSGYNRIMNVPCLSGCFMFLRVDILKNTGLFDDRFFMYCEDFDFYKRIHAKYKTIFYPEVTVIHAHKKESYVNKKLLKYHIISAIKYFNKWGWFIDKDRRKANRFILRELYNSKSN